MSNYENNLPPVIKNTGVGTGTFYAPGTEYGYGYQQSYVSIADVINAKSAIDNKEETKAVTNSDIKLELDYEEIKPIFKGYTIELEEFLSKVAKILSGIFVDFDGIAYSYDQHGNVMPYIGFKIDPNLQGHKIKEVGKDKIKELTALKSVNSVSSSRLNSMIENAMNFKNIFSRDGGEEMRRFGVTFDECAIDILSKFILSPTKELFGDNKYKYFNSSLCIPLFNTYGGYNNVNVTGLSFEKMAKLIHGPKYTYKVVLRNNSNKILIEVTALDSEALKKLERKIIGASVGADYIR